MNGTTAARPRQPGGAATHAHVDPVADQLLAEFRALIDASTVSTVIRDAVHDLQGSTTAACTVGQERLARRRLVALARTAKHQAHAERRQ